MSRALGGWRLTAFLLLVCAGLAALLALEWRGRSTAGPSGGGRSASPSATASAPAAPDPYTPPALASFDAILARPLFIPDRRPAEVPEPAAEPARAPTVALRARLEGVVRIGATSVALIRDLSKNEAVRLAQGMELQGWTLERVEAERVVLTRTDGEVHELKLERQRD